MPTKSFYKAYHDYTIDKEYLKANNGTVYNIIIL